MSFEDSIKEWVSLDNELRQHSTAVKQLRQQRNTLSDSILTYVVDNNMTHSTVKISDGILKFHNIKVTSPLTFKFITKCLNDCISDENQVKQLIQYIKQKREIRYIPEVKRNYAK